MKQKSELKELRDVASRYVSDREVSPSAADTARYLLTTMRREAVEKGFTEADVVRAVLKTVFREEKGCDCYSCKARRAESDEYRNDGPSRVGIGVE